MIGAQSGSRGTDARGSEPVAGDESEGLTTQTSLEAKSVFGSIAAECAASMAGSIHPSSDGTICSGLRARVVAGVISRALSDGNVGSIVQVSKPDMGWNPSNIKSP